MTVWDNQQARTSWFSGILEAEGCAHLSKRNTAEISLSNTDRDIIDAAVSFLTERSIPYSIGVMSSTVKKLQNKRAWQVTVYSANECYTLIKYLGNTLQCRRQEFMEKLELRASETPRDTPLRADVNWFVGFFEGEGCLYIAEHRRRHKGPLFLPRVAISNTSSKLLEKVALTLKELGQSWHVTTDSTSNPLRACFKIEIYGYKRCQRFLKVMRDLWRSSTYSRRAEILSKFCETRLAMDKSEPYTEEQRQIYLSMRVKR